MAGEASGDMLAAHLVAALRERRPDLRFIGIAGPRMQSAGVEAVYPLEKLAVRGYVEVIRQLREIIAIRSEFRRRLLQERPALFIGVDAPDFNLDLELKLRNAGIPTVHYVSPSIWAWRKNRIHKIKRAVSLMLTVFPFEAPIYEEAGVPVAYVGHPRADMLAELPAQRAVREELRLPQSAPIVALLPGSRVSELENMAELFVNTAAAIRDEMPDVRFLVPLISRETRDIFEAALYKRPMEPLELTMLFGHALEAMSAADVVLVASGTATLEAALLKRPMVITYRMPTLSWWLMYPRRLMRHAGLPNILAGEEIVPEFLQKDATPEKLARAVVDMLRDVEAREKMDRHFEAIRTSLRQNTAERASAAILAMLEGGHHGGKKGALRR